MFGEDDAFRDVLVTVSPSCGRTPRGVVGSSFVTSCLVGIIFLFNTILLGQLFQNEYQIIGCGVIFPVVICCHRYSIAC